MNEKTIVLDLDTDVEADFKVSSSMLPYRVIPMIVIELQDWSEEHKQWMGASLDSNLKADPEPDNDDFNICVDGLEALILQMAVNGIDIDTPVMIKSINDALEGIGNNT